MPVELRMPALSPTMEKGTLARWLVGVGDAVRPGDLLAEIETDKATMEFEAIDEGRVAEILVAGGTDDVPVGAIIALLTAEGDAASVAPVASAPAEMVVAPSRGSADEATPSVTVPEAEVEAEPAPAAPAASPPSFPLDINATPLARRIATAAGIDLSTVTGSGARGRIVKADLGLAPPAERPLPMTAAAELPVAPPSGVPVESVRLSTMRRTIARRLTEAKRQVPHFYLTVRCRLDPLLALRADLNAGLAAQGVKLSVNDLLMKAMALALVEVPDANVQFGGEVLHRFGRVDLSMAVAIEGGLVTPVIHGVDTLSLSAIARIARTHAERARDGSLKPEDYEGGTASISNLGMFGIDEMIPVINPPQALILGIGAGVEQPWKVDGALGLATIMAATASFDHRAIDGAVAARFMAAFRALVEQPLAICC